MYINYINIDIDIDIGIDIGLDIVIYNFNSCK